MDPDLPLIEIAAEDDSLLQQPFPSNDDLTFSFSPLQLHIPKSHTISSSSPLSFSSRNSTVSSTSSQVHGSVSTSSNKENLNNIENKLGVTNLSVEPQKMKRSKKAGGYNLRKSLAWDRAFLTEEGVLNDSELSMITGTRGDGVGLSVIEEQKKDSLPTNSGSAHQETLEEDLFKELPSGYPNKRNATHRSLMKRDSISGGCLASVSKSSQKFHPPGHGLKKAVSKGEVCSSPMASVSQKRLSSTGTKQFMTKNTKIPKLPVSKKNPSVPSMTTNHSTAGGSSLKDSRIPQPATRKSLSSKSSSKTKHASNASKASLELVPKSSKPSVDVGNDVTNSALQRPSLMSLSHGAQDITKVSKFTENSSSQGLLSGGADMVKSHDERSSTTASALVHLDNAGLNGKNVQAQGLKPSGLRMPSPSLRFFSETKAPISNTLSQDNCMPPKLLKSSIPKPRNSEVADHYHDFKPTQLLHGASNVNAMGKAGLRSQKTDKGSTSSIAASKVHANLIQEKCNQQAIDVQVPVGVQNSGATNHEQYRYDNLEGCEKQYKDQVPISLKVADKDSKDNKSICSDVVSQEASYNGTLLCQEERTADRSMVDVSSESCPEVQFFKACETNAEVQSQIFEPVHESQTNPNSHHNKLMLAPDSESPNSILDDHRTPGESNSCGLDQTNSEQSMKEQPDERTLLANGKSSNKLDEDDSVVPLCTGEDSTFSRVTAISNVNCCVASGSNYKHVDDEQDEIIIDSKSSTMKLSESSVELEEAIENCAMQLRNSTNSIHYDTQDICAVNLDIVELSSHSASTSPELLNEVPVEFYRLCNSDQGERQSQSSKHRISDNCASPHGALIGYNQCTELTKDTFSEADKQQVLNNELLAKEVMLQSNDADLNYNIVSQSSPCQVESMEEVKDQINLLSCLPSNGNGSTLETTHLEFQLSGVGSEDQVALAVASPDAEESLSPVNKHEISCRDVLMRETVEEYIESDKPGCNLSPTEARMKISEHVDGLTDESTSEDIDDKDATTIQRTDDLKLTRPPLNVVPFSDEWLAAIESAGELDKRTLIANGKSSNKLEEDDSTVPVCTGEDSICRRITRISNVNCSVASGSNYKHVDDEQDEIIIDSKSSTMKLTESSVVLDEAIENCAMQLRNFTNSKQFGTQDICAVNLDIVELSSHCASTSPELLNEVPVEFYRLCNNSDQELTKDTLAEADKQQVLNNKLLAKEMMLQSNEADLNCNIVSQSSSCPVESTEEVKDQINLLSRLPSNGNDSTLETTHLEFQLSGVGSEDQVALAVANSDAEESLCPVNKHEISCRDVLMGETVEDYIESDKPGCNLSPTEARMNIFEHVVGLTDESTCKTEDIDDKDATTKQRTDDLKLTRPPLNVVPFSDEWLAAIESAGEEILTLKTGAVKHSPPDKSTLEPGPWSPVKRKTNQIIGPFDCTKYTNTQPDNIN